MVHIIVFLVKLLVAGAKIDITVSGWDGFFDQIIALLRQIKDSQGESGTEE